MRRIPMRRLAAPDAEFGQFGLHLLQAALFPFVDRLVPTVLMPNSNIQPHLKAVAAARGFVQGSIESFDL